MAETKHTGGFLNSMSPKGAFFLGLGSALVLFFIVGFFVLLGIVLKDGEGGKVAGNSAPNQPALQQPDAAAGAADQGVSAEGMAPISSSDWVYGNPDAKVTVVEYSDLECPFCKRHHPTLLQLVSEYDGQVNWVFRHFPLVNLHSKAPKEAEATECAGELGGNEGFWKFTNRLMEITPANNGFNLEELPDVAEYAGINAAQFNECLNSDKYAGKVQQHYQDAVQAGGQGTPYNVIVAGDQKIPISGAVPIETFRQVIDSLL